MYYLTEFEYLKRNLSELAADFIKRFNKLYNKMPPDCKPPATVAKVRFSKAFEYDFVVMHRKRKYKTLADMQTNTIEIKANRSIAAKLRAKAKNTKKRMKAREEGTSSKTKYEDHKLMK